MPRKTELFDRVARELGFETVEESDRNARFRFPELVKVYDALETRNVVSLSRRSEWSRADLRGQITEALTGDDDSGRPVTKPVLSELVGVLCVPETATDGGVLTATQTPNALDPYPTENDYQRAEDEGYVYPWVTVEECVVVSKKQNSTRYHSRWTVDDDGTLRPACNGYRPGPDREHRLVEEESISRTKDECSYCQNERVRL